MAELSVKKKFFDRLAVRMSFHFSDSDMTNIIGDYEDNFYDDSEKGMSEGEICAARGTPADIVGNLLAEYRGFAARAVLLLRTTKFWTVILMAAQIIVGLCLLRGCNENGQTYTYCALGINLAYFIVAAFIARKSAPERPRLEKGNIALAVIAAVILLSEAFVLPVLKFPSTGIYCEYIECFLIAILLCVNIYRVVRGYTVAGLHQYSLSTIFHASGIIMVLFCLINQSGLFYDDINIADMHRISSGIIVYAETVLLGIILHLIGSRRGGKQ